MRGKRYVKNFFFHVGFIQSRKFIKFYRLGCCVHRECLIGKYSSRSIRVDLGLGLQIMETCKRSLIIDLAKWMVILLQWESAIETFFLKSPFEFKFKGSWSTSDLELS